MTNRLRTKLQHFLAAGAATRAVPVVPNPPGMIHERRQPVVLCLADIPS